MTSLNTLADYPAHFARRAAKIQAAIDRALQLAAEADAEFIALVDTLPCTDDKHRGQLLDHAAALLGYDQVNRTIGQLGI